MDGDAEQPMAVVESTLGILSGGDSDSESGRATSGRWAQPETGNNLY